MLTEIGARLRRWRRRLSRAEWERRFLGLPPRPAPAHSPGLLLLCVEDLSGPGLENAFASGHAPFLRDLVTREGARLHPIESEPGAGSPATTGDLLREGASWGDRETSGAAPADRHLPARGAPAREAWTSRRFRLVPLAILHLPSLTRVAVWAGWELALAARDLLRGEPELACATVGRLGRDVFRREALVNGVKIDLARGVPIIRATFDGYAAQRSLRGPRSPSARLALRGLDRAIRHLHRAARRSEGRDYEVWIVGPPPRHGGEPEPGVLVLPPASDHLLPANAVSMTRLHEAALRHLGRSPRPAHRRRSPQPPAAQLRVVTYNVHYCKGLDGRFAPERIARVLRDLDPDIVALQELDCGRPRSRGDDQLAYLAAELGLHHLFAPSIVKGEERYGHGLLSTRPLRLVRQARLPTGGVPVIEPRDGLHAAVEFAGREISLVTTHLGLAFAERAAQIDRLLADDFLGLPPDRPALFLGDLNLVPGGKLYRRLVARWGSVNGHAVFRDVQAHAPNHVAVKTFPSFLPVRQLDHIFVTPHFGILGVRSPANLLTRRASDHLPLVADLELHA